MICTPSLVPEQFYNGLIEAKKIKVIKYQEASKKKYKNGKLVAGIIC
jgi:hypothetical protein